MSDNPQVNPITMTEGCEDGDRTTIRLRIERHGGDGIVTAVLAQRAWAEVDATRARVAELEAKLAHAEQELAAIKRPCAIRRGHEVEDMMAHGQQVLCSTFMVAQLFDERIKADARAAVLRDAAVRASAAFDAWGRDEDGIHPEAWPAVKQLRAVINLVESDDLADIRRRVLDAELADLPAGYYVFRKKDDGAGAHFDVSLLTDEAAAALGELGVEEAVYSMPFGECVDVLRRVIARETSGERPA